MRDALDVGAWLSVYLCCSSVCVAALEIEIEGPDGWAKRLPTWRRRCVLCGDRPLTGYHVGLALTLIGVSLAGSVTDVLLHDGPPSNVLFSLALFTLIMATEDRYWYALNYEFHDAVARGEARDHFDIASQTTLYVVCVVVAFALWLGGAWIDGNVYEGIAVFWIASVGLVVTYPAVVWGLAPIYARVRRVLKQQADVVDAAQDGWSFLALYASAVWHVALARAVYLIAALVTARVP